MSNGMITASDISDDQKPSIVTTMEDFVYEKLSELIVDERTSPEFIVLLWKELWAADESKISAANRMVLLNLIVSKNTHGVSYLELIASVFDSIIEVSDYSENINTHRSHVNLLESLFINTVYDSPEQVDADTISTLLPLFENKTCIYWSRLIVESGAFPISLAIDAALDGHTAVQVGIRSQRMDDVRKEAIKILSEGTDEDFSSVPDAWLWSILKWDWLLETAARSYHNERK